VQPGPEVTASRCTEKTYKKSIHPFKKKLKTSRKITEIKSKNQKRILQEHQQNKKQTNPKRSKK
jgi:hypothetical protein